MEIKPVDADADAGAGVYVDYTIGGGAFDAADFHPGGGEHPVYGCIVHGDLRGLRDRSGSARHISILVDVRAVRDHWHHPDWRSGIYDDWRVLCHAS